LVAMIERALRLGTAASGNPRGMLHARFGAGPHPLPRFVLAAYGHALGLYDDVLPIDGVTRAECGLLDLAFSEKARARIGRLAELDWPMHLLEIVNAAQASQLAGVAMMDGGLWFPAGGWVHPPTLSANLADDERITQCFGHVAETLERTAAGWRVSGHDTQGKAWTAEAEVVLVCCALSAKQFSPFAHFPLMPVRGQITAVPATASSRALQAIVCGDGYCAPAVDGVHVIGATHTFSDEADDLRMTDHAENLARLTAYAPALRRALGDVNAEQLTGRASVRCSAPGAMPLVGMVQEGLYCSLAHGTRGLITAGLAGELLAAHICGQLAPLPEAIVSALAPVPRTSREVQSDGQT
jgi:tRNA 5-methylaminomethyl-2-thiouridine biosynthesis bifunctional protein